VGDPIDHSLSPRLHTEVLRRLDRNLIYLPFPVSADRLRRFVREAWAFGVSGLNVTTPYKETVARFVQAADEETARTGVVNTILYRGGEALGCGTDGAGILGFLRASGLGDEPFGVLGFGASARSLVSRALLEAAPVAAVATTRPSAARRTVGAWGGTVRVGTLVDLLAGRGDGPGGPPPRVWVSTLPPTAPPPPGPFWRSAGARGVLCDLNYGPGRTVLAERAREAGWRAADGRGPLCHQAALSLGIWLGTEVPVHTFFRALGRTARSLRPVR
jgi:shikimate dehydrogenase